MNVNITIFVVIILKFSIVSLSGFVLIGNTIDRHLLTGWGVEARKWTDRFSKHKHRGSILGNSMPFLEERTLLFSLFLSSYLVQGSRFFIPVTSSRICLAAFTSLESSLLLHQNRLWITRQCENKYKTVWSNRNMAYLLVCVFLLQFCHARILLWTIELSSLWLSWASGGWALGERRWVDLSPAHWLMEF